MITDLRFVKHMNGTRSLQAYHADVSGYDESGVPHFSGRGHWESVGELPYGMEEVEDQSLTEQEVQP